MKLGLSFFPSRPKLLIPLAQKADETGFESVWIAEHVVFPTKVDSRYPYREVGAPLPTTPLYDPIVLMGYVAAVTKRIQLGTGIYILPARHPIPIARMVATADILSNGRVLLGVGVGWLAEELEAVGSEYETRGARTDEIIEVMRRLWTEPLVANDGRFYPFPEVGFEPKPARAPVPILVGGESPGALRRTARLGDGWFGMDHTPESAGERIRQLQALRTEAGRTDPLEFTVQCSLPPTLDNLKRYEDVGVDRVWFSHKQFATEDRKIESTAAEMEKFADGVIAKL